MTTKRKTKKRVVTKKQVSGNGQCMCGCGQDVKLRFAQGHDSRYHSWISAQRKFRDGKIDQAALEAKRDELAGKGVDVLHITLPE